MSMRVSARFAKGFVSFCLILLLTVTVLPLLSPVYAKTSAQQKQSLTPSPSVNPYTKPYTDNTVPQNQHIITQAFFLEMLGAIGCQLSGIDLISPSQPCLGINPATEKLGFEATGQNGQSRIGGLLGIAANGIGVMYTPTYGTHDYINKMANNFGLVKHAYAAEGFVSLSPIIKLWEASRNIAYFLLVIAFIFIGIGVMLRLKIDPRTVMTVQNKIPDVIIAIILITFSYAISGILVDLMWTTTYIGINTITNFGANPEIPNCTASPKHLNTYATENLLSSPFGFANNIFLSEDCGAFNSDIFDSGIFDLSRKVGFEVAGLEENLLLAFIGVDPSQSCSPTDWVTGKGSITDCPRIWFGNILGFFASILWFIIIFIVVVVTLFRIWFQLLKAYVLTLMYVILGPLFIVMGLLPKKPLGFERWMRVSFANLAVFPATVTMLILARVIMVLFDSSNPVAQGTTPGLISQVYAQTPGFNQFLPPLIGNPGATGFGALLGFGVLLLTPEITSLIKEKLGVPPVKQATAALGAIAVGTGAVGGVARRTWGGLNRRNPTTGTAEGPVSRFTEGIQRGVAHRLSNAGVPLISNMARKHRERIDSRRQGRGYVTEAERAGMSDRAYRRQQAQQAQTQTREQQDQQLRRDFNNTQTTARDAGRPVRYTTDEQGLERFRVERDLGQAQARQAELSRQPANPENSRELARLAPEIARLTEALRQRGDRGLINPQQNQQQNPPQNPGRPGGTPPTQTT